MKAKNIEQFFEMQERTRSFSMNKNKLCVIICASQKNKNLDRLLGALNNQSYDKENYEVNVLYKKTQNDTLNRDFALGARFHNIEEEEYFSQDKVINDFIHNILPEKKFDAFVFLGAQRIIGEKYLENINRSITGEGVFVGSKISINEKEHFAKRIKNSIISTYLKYTDRTRNIVRSMFDLPFLIDGQNLVVTADIIEKIGYIAIEDKDSQLEYSFELIANGIKSTYSPYIITGVDVRDFDFSSATLKCKISTFIHYFPILILKNIASREFTFLVLKPNSLFVICSYILMSYIYINFYYSHRIFDALFFIITLFLFANLVISLKVSKMQPKEIFWLILYPLCLTWQKTKILFKNLTMKSILESQYDEENINSATFPSIVFNGKKNIECKIDLVQEDGMKKVVYREGGRFISTDSFIRMYDALEDMSYKLRTKGLVLKTCQNCMHFTLNIDGTLDCLKGKCAISNNDILIWNGCQYFNLHPDKQDKN